jgi:hypothetical protein
MRRSENREAKEESREQCLKRIKEVLQEER